MFKKHKARRTPSLNTTSTSDISFMLLIFFLVTTSIDSEKGLSRRLPPPPEDASPTELTVEKRNTLVVTVDGDNRVTCEGSVVSLQELKARVEAFVENKGNDPALPEKRVRDIPLLGQCAVTDNHVISLEVDRRATYDAYFHTQEAIVAAYNALRDRLSRERFGHSYSECSKEEQAALAVYYPQRISETEPEPQAKGGLQ